MIIHPSDGFDDWRSFLIGTLEPGGEYSSFLNDAAQLINEIIEFNSLLSPNTNFTESFVTETLVELVNKIMNFANVQQQEKTNIVKFIKNAQVLIPWAALNDRIDLFDSFFKLIDQKTPFLQFISKAKEIQELNDHFLNHEFLTLVSLRISKNNNVPVSYDHINLFFRLMNNFPKMSETTHINLFLTVTPIFAEILKNFDINSNFQSFTCNKFLETLQIFIRSTEFLLGESTNMILTTSLNIAFLLLKLDAFDKQNLGASILTLFSASKEKTVKESFFNFMKNKNFVADLMERDLHYEVLETILPVFKLLVSSKQITQSDLIRILHATTKVNFDQQEIFFNLIIDSIKPLNVKDSISFFNKISPTLNVQVNENESHFQSDNDYSIIFLRFAVLSLLRIKNCSHELVSVIIDQIVEIASIYPNQSEVIELVKQLCDKNVPEEIKYPLLKKCKSKFEQQYSPFLISILTQLFNMRKSQNYSIDFNNDFFVVLQKHLLSTNDKSFLYELFSKLLHSQHKKITNEMINAILNDSKTDMLWNFLSQVIDNDGKNAFEDDSFISLQNFVNDYTETNSQCFFEFLQKIMIIVNLEAGNLKEESLPKSKNTDKTKLILIKTPLIFEQKLINAIENQGNLFKTIKSILLNLFKNCEPESLSITHLIDLFKTINVKDQNGMVKLYQFLRIINSFCKKYGNKDRNRIISHDFKISNEKQFYIARYKVNVLNESKNDFNFIVDIQSDAAIAFLISLISPNLLYPLDRYQIMLDGKEIYTFNAVKYLSHTQIINATLLKEVNVNFSNDPTYILTKKGFTNKLLSFLNEIPIDINDKIDKNDDKQQEDDILINDDEKINKKIIGLIISVLNMIPTDENLLISSADPTKFLQTLSECQNPYQVQYLIQILNWRLFSNKYLELYKKENILLNTLIKMCNENSTLLSKSTEEFLQLFKKLNCINSNESVVPLMHIISMKNLDAVNKKEYILYLIKMKSNISEVFSNNPELLGDLIENLNENNFETLWPYISKIKDFNTIYDMSLSRLQNQTTNSTPFFTKIFFHYLSHISTNDIVKQLNTCIQLLIDSSMSSIQNPVGIVSAMKQLVDNNIAKLASASNLINKFFVLISSGYPKDAQKMLYNICCSLSDISQENKVALISFIDNISTLNIEKWNILPDEDQSVVAVNTKLKGLRNLGSTCYMNSILQQFFSIYAFDFLLAQTKSLDSVQQQSKKGVEDHSFHFLQKLFCSLSMSKRSSCDTKQFFETWSQSHTHALPSEQHDATEFMQFFLGDMPESIASLYTGTITNFIESEDHSFKTQIDESFISIPISIDKYKSVEESLSSILNPQKLFGNNQYTKPDGVKVNAESYQKIKSAPPVLILQLARFKFNQSTKMREKINSRFEIAEKINISNILTSNETKNNSYSSYTLNGVVVHRGDGNHGHYISYIKNREHKQRNYYNDQVKKWLRFDDMDITEVDQNEFEKESFGSNLTQQISNEINNMSGYLLFYIANNSTIEIKKSKSINIPVLSNESIEYPQEITKEVIHDNEIYLNEKSAFTTSTFEFILEEANPTQLCDFFFKVFCHSLSKGKIVTSFEEHINNLINNKEENEELIEWLIANVASIISIFINCNSSDITNSVNNIILKSISNSSAEKGGKLISMFVLYLHNCLEAWRQVYNISNIILSYLKIRKENVDFAINDKWPESLVQFVIETYNGERQEYFLQNINISPVFDSLDILLRNDLKEIYKPLLSIHQQIQKSPSLKNYRNLIVHCASSELFPIEDVVSIFPNELKDSNIMEIKFGKMNDKTNLEEINNSLKVANISQNKIIDFIYENRPQFKNYLILKQNMNYLYNLFLINSNEIECYITENLQNEKDQQILQPFFDFVLSKMEEISTKENQNVVLSYLRIVLFLMKKVNYPHDKNLEELKYFTKYQNKNEFIQISSYVGNPLILTIYDQKFPQKEEKKGITMQAVKEFFTKPPTINKPLIITANNNSITNDFIEIVKNILNSSDSVVDKFINKPNICEITSKSISTIQKQADIEIIVRFIEFLKARKNQNPAQITKILYSLISGNDQNISYIISISKYFDELINELNYNEITYMLRIINAILKCRSNEKNDEALQFFSSSIFSYLTNVKINFDGVDTSLLTLNSDYISHYLSENSSVTNIMVNFVTRIAKLNVNFRKESEKTFQRYLFNSFNLDETIYHCASFLAYYCFIDVNKKEDEIVKYLTEILKYLGKIKNDKWRNIFFKHMLGLMFRNTPKVPNWAKLLVNETFRYASLSCEKEISFFKLVLNEMNDDFPKFIMSYTRSFVSDCYKLSCPKKDDKIRAINQLEQLVFLLNNYPDERSTIFQFLDVKKEWFKNQDYQKYKKLIFPNEK